ncbi:hypothetical protein FB45DRAFT_819314 [Roridomyces roridus]|uniref:PIN domain-like protein n=1 Tax=Roridomyces roridus TaxID=1738132 RepID=A0AAD7CIU5_9AGAR|nr:hypothetical protein FB45DRAFT_819314 [Roridomyces roridus]
MGVKSLWKLLSPVGRPVMLETMEGQIMAIDSSIWIYQFQATMRDNDGRALSNAHVLGFLRRIAKLLFYGIKPVFVFDGGAPALKRNTLNDRRKKKSGAASSHAKLAEKLLAAQLRRAAVNGAQKPVKGKGKAPAGPPVLDDNTVYLEDIQGSTPMTPAVRKQPDTQPTTVSPSKPKFHDHDPYRLPDLDLEAAINSATRAPVPDPRLATEDELREFIEDMRPEDFDITSPAFRELPTEVQYEIVGDLRLKSRQTSYARLQNMLKSARTPLDFSKQQIQNLRQRNTLTQQLLMTTDSIGKANITIPVRVASERNREYVLIKNEGHDGGWILGIRDDGTKEKPIEIDQDEKKAVVVPDDDSDEEMEEVAIPSAGAPDADLQEYQRSMNLAAIASRHAAKKPPLPQRTKSAAPPTRPLFELDDEDAMIPIDDDEDAELALAIQESIDQANASTVRVHRPPLVNAVASSSKLVDSTPRKSSDSVTRHSLHDDDVFLHGNRLETALSIGGVVGRTPTKPPAKGHSSSPVKPSFSLFGEPVLLHQETPPKRDLTLVASDTPLDRVPEVGGLSFGKPVLLQSDPGSSASAIQDDAGDGSDEEMEEVVPVREPSPISRRSFSPLQPDMMEEEMPPEPSQFAEVTAEIWTDIQTPPSFTPATDLPIPVDDSTHVEDSPNLLQPEDLVIEDANLEDEEPGTLLIDWSRSPSPLLGQENQPRKASPIPEDWDAAQEMDPAAEEGEFARFMSQVKGKDLSDVQREIDAEIKVLNEQKKAAMRDEGDINQQMISQIMTMLSLFGIPYITAPMEAEAQCAELVHLGLVNGVITDDSDVFLFGSQRVFKNMFNQSKTVECFLLSDLSRELGLDRDTLIRLAYLLGSDYVDGLPGVGPVVAMELLEEFPGQDGLHKFKDWWTKVQSGKDREQDNKSKFRKRFKKKFKDLYIPPEWPNPVVRDAYYHPTVDESDEPFKWGLPDLDALRHFIYAELGWPATKVDELLLPVIQKIRKRGQAGAVNKQGDLNAYFDVGAGSGTVAPRKRKAYDSKRLQQVISDFRKKQKRGSKEPAEEGSEADDDTGDHDADEPTKRKAAKKAPAKGKGPSRGGRRGRGRGRGAKVDASRKSKDEDEAEFQGQLDGDEGLAVQLRPRPKPKPAYGRSKEDVDDTDSES